MQSQRPNSYIACGVFSMVTVAILAMVAFQFIQVETLAGLSPQAKARAWYDYQNNEGRFTTFHAFAYAPFQLGNLGRSSIFPFVLGGLCIPLTIGFAASAWHSGKAGWQILVMLILVQVFLMGANGIACIAWEKQVQDGRACYEKL